MIRGPVDVLATNTWHGPDYETRSYSIDVVAVTFRVAPNVPAEECPYNVPDIQMRGEAAGPGGRCGMSSAPSSRQSGRGLRRPPHSSADAVKHAANLGRGDPELPGPTRFWVGHAQRSPYRSRLLQSGPCSSRHSVICFSFAASSSGRRIAEMRSQHRPTRMRSTSMRIAGNATVRPPRRYSRSSTARRPPPAAGELPGRGDGDARDIEGEFTKSQQPLNDLVATRLRALDRLFAQVHVLTQERSVCSRRWWRRNARSRRRCWPPKSPRQP